MSSFCVYRVVLKPVPVGMDQPKEQARLYVNGAMVADREIPIDTAEMFFAAPADSKIKFVTGHHDAAKVFPVKWADRAVSIHAEHLEAGEYAVEHLGHVDVADEGCQFGLATSSDELAAALGVSIDTPVPEPVTDAVTRDNGEVAPVETSEEPSKDPSTTQEPVEVPADKPAEVVPGGEISPEESTEVQPSVDDHSEEVSPTTSSEPAKDDEDPSRLI